MNAFLNRRITFLFLLLVATSIGFSQEEGMPLSDPEPAPNINPEHFRFFLIATAIAVVAGIAFVIARSYKRDKQRKTDLISQILKAHKSGDLIEADYEELKKYLDPLQYDLAAKAFGLALTNKRRHNYLYSKYPQEMAKDLFEFKHWIGMSVEQLVDSRGHAEKTEDEILKDKTVKILTYRTKSGEENFSFVKGILESTNGK